MADYDGLERLKNWIDARFFSQGMAYEAYIEKDTHLVGLRNFVTGDTGKRRFEMDDWRWVREASAMELFEYAFRG